MMFLGVPIIEVWTHTQAVLPSKELLMACNISIIGSGLATACVMVTNGTNHLKVPTLIGLIMTLVAVFCANNFELIIKLLSVFFSNNLIKNTESIVWTFTVLCDVIPSFFYYLISKRIIKQMRIKC